MYRDLRSLATGTRFWVCALVWLGRSKLAVGIMSLPSTTGFLGPSGHAQMCNMADTGQGLATEAVGTNGSKIFECLQL